MERNVKEIVSERRRKAEIPENAEQLENFRLVGLGVDFSFFESLTKKVSEEKVEEFFGIVVKNERLTEENVEAIRVAGYKRSAVKSRKRDSTIFEISRKRIDENWAKSPYSSIS